MNKTLLRHSVTLALGVFMGLIMSSSSDNTETTTKLSPVLLVSYFSEAHTLNWRLTITNDYTLELDPSTGKRMVFEYHYGNRNNLIELKDGNKL